MKTLIHEKTAALHQDPESPVAQHFEKLVLGIVAQHAQDTHKLLLDKEGDGFVLTSLHARAGTRVFAKPIKQGLSDVYQLSKEEQETIEEAMNFEIK